MPAAPIEVETQPTGGTEATGWRLPYLPSLDGLRAIAVTGVLLYHAGMLWLPGGFLGVEVFFVISGYLITSLLLAEWQKHGRINLLGFWLRRARRLLPALFLVIAVALTFSVLFIPEEVAGLRDDTIAATGYVTNWYLVFSQQSYFEQMGRPSMLQHLWSLAVEEQFYLLWPLLFAAGMRFLRRGLVLICAVSGAVTSALLMALLYQPDVDPSRIYYGTDTRAAGILLGVSLAFLWAPWQHRPSQSARWASVKPLLLDLAGIGALASIVCFFLYLDEFQPFLYQGGFAALGLVTTAAIAVTVHPQARLLPRVLGTRVLRWVGLRSYGIYLWHWPIFMVTRPELDVPFDGLPLFLLRIAATLVLTELSYRYIETPIRKGGLVRAWRGLRATPGIAWGSLAARRGGVAATLVACLIVGASVVSAQPPAPPSYLSGDSIEIISSEDLASPGDMSQTPGATSQGTEVVTTAATSEAKSAAQQEVSPPSPTSEPASTATSTATATSVASPTATATVRPPDAVTTTGVNLRAGPSKAYAIIRVLSEGDGLTVLGKLRGNSWYKVRTNDGIEGWAFAGALRPNIDPANVPVVAASPVSQGQQAAAEAVVTAAPAATATSVPAAPPSEPTQLPPEEAPPGPPADKPEEVPVDTPTVPAAPPPPPSTPIRITAIGDSVMQGAAREMVRVLGALGPTEVDAAKSRQVSQAINVLRAKRDAGKLGDVVVIHMGTNGTFTAKQFDQIMALLSDVPRVVFVNLKVPRQWEANNNKVITEGVQRYPNTVMVDWRGASSGQSTLFAKDGIHLQRAGAQLYTSLIAAQIQAP